MKKAPFPKNESDRLAELLSLKILDTPAEADFDSLTALASIICETPIALVSLIDDKRQWFKSHHGLAATETPRDISFCGHAIHQDDILEINNSLDDERFTDNPLVTGEPRVIFYAGMPLKSSNGHNLGTLCVIDHEKKQLNSTQRETLRVLAQQVVAQMEIRKRNEDLQNSFHKIKEQALMIEQHKNQSILSAKMASLGLLAAGTAHEINNPLAIIQGATSKLSILANNSTDEEIIKTSYLISKTVQRISIITHGLLAFSKKTGLEKQAESLPVILKDTLFFCQGRLEELGINLIKSNISDAKILCNPTEISQVLLNLINNAIDSIKNIDNKWIEIKTHIINDSLEIQVINSGEAIPKEIQNRIFDPFFTTKDIGSGTGLGLSISKGIVEGHSGKLYLDSSQKQTCFVLSVPIIKSSENPSVA